MSERSIDAALATIERHQRIRQVMLVLGVALVAFATFLGLQYLSFDFSELQKQWSPFVDSLGSFLPPNFVDFTLHSQNHGIGAKASEKADGVFELIYYRLAGIGASLANPTTFVETLTSETGTTSTIVGMAAVTIIIGFCGTVLGFPLALLFGVLGSERVVPFPFNFLFRGTMSTIRAVPALVWILIFIPLAGISPVSAVLAIGTDTIGNLGRLFTDELEEIEEGPIEAIRSTGAGSSQVITFGMLSQVSSSFVAWTLYILEINTRVAISLGVVGAGGIGQYIQLKISYLAYDKAAAGIAMVVVIVLSVELLSSRLRARLRPGENVGTDGGLLDRIRGLGDMDKWLGRSKET